MPKNSISATREEANEFLLRTGIRGTVGVHRQIRATDVVTIETAGAVTADEIRNIKACAETFLAPGTRVIVLEHGLKFKVERGVGRIEGVTRA